MARGPQGGCIGGAAVENRSLLLTRFARRGPSEGVSMAELVVVRLRSDKSLLARYR